MILPKWYYYRAGKSDRQFIEARMSHIPADKQQAVADEYERLYGVNGYRNVKEGRKAANTYLHEEAKKHQQERSPEAYQRHLDKMRSMVEKPKAKKVQTSSGVINQNALPDGVKGIQLDW